MLLPSAGCTVSFHVLSVDQGLSRHSITSHAPQPLVLALHLQQLSATKFDICKYQLLPTRIPITFSSYFTSIAREGHASWFRNVGSSQISLKAQTLSSVSSRDAGEDAVSFPAQAGLTETLIALSQDGTSFSGSPVESTELTDATSSGRDDHRRASSVQVHGKELSFDDSGDLQRLPINLDLDIYRAKCLFRKREYNEAEKILRQCIKDWPTDGKAYVALGSRLMKLGRFVEARKIYEDGCQAARGENPYIWQAWAVLEQKLGHFSQARKLFDAATVADIKHVAAWHGWAVLELHQGNVRKAGELLSKGLKFCGANEYLYQTFALIKYRSGKVDDARAFFSQAVSWNPKSCASWLAWALVEAENNNISTARYLFQSSLRASPKNRYAWQAWALFECSQENNAWARKLFEQGIKLNPNDAVLLQAYALFEYDCCNLEQARELFKLAAAKDPKHQPIWNAWGWMEWKEKNFALGRLYYRKSLSINSQTSEAARVFHAWAKLEEDAGDYAAARRLYQYALRVDPENIISCQSWAIMEEKLQNRARAEEIRMQYYQERIEVVDEASWDLSFSSMFAPAINRIKDFLNISAPSSTNDDSDGPVMPEILEVLNRQKLDMDNVNCDEDFDLDAFIQEVVPGKHLHHSKSFRDRFKRLKVMTTSS